MLEGGPLEKFAEVARHNFVANMFRYNNNIKKKFCEKLSRKI